MKKILHMTAAIMCAAVLLTSCENTLTPSEVDVAAALAETVASGNDVTTPFNLVGQPVYNFDDLKNSLITLSFTLPVDSNSVASGITVSSLSSSTASDVPYAATALTPTYTVVGKDVYIALNLEGKDSIEVFINAANLLASNGQKLDRDGDYIQGETNDDDIYKYTTLTAAGLLLTGCQRNPHEVIVIDPFDDAGFSAAGTGGTDTFTVTIGNITTEDLKTLLDTNIQIQTYAAKAWTTVTKASSAYNTTTHVYTCTFASQADGVPIRAYIADRQAIVTSNPINGFVRKATLNGRLKGYSIANRTTYAPGSTRMLTGQNFTVPEYTATRTSNTPVEDTYQFMLKELTLSFNSSAFIASVYGVAADPDLEYNGIDRTTFTNDNVKIALYFDSKEYFLPFSSVFFVNKDTARIILNSAVYLPSEFVEVPDFSSPSLNVYVGPGLKTLAGVNDDDAAVAAYSFGSAGSYLGQDTEGFYRVIQNETVVFNDLSAD
jgi:hypothetical protein